MGYMSGELRKELRKEITEFTLEVQNKYDVVLRLGLKVHVTEVLKRTTIIIGYIYVHTEMQRKGVGTKVMQELTHWADARGYNLILEPGTSKELDLVKFYTKFGFELIDEERKKELFKGKSEVMEESMIRLSRRRL